MNICPIRMRAKP